MTHESLLVVDDNAATRYAVRRVLERHGYAVQEAGTGGDGLALVAAGGVDALILDVNLPDMSGFDVVRQLRTDPRTALLPVVHVSAASIETGDLITGLDAGADAYLIHPIDPDVLLATLRTLLRVRDTEAALRESEARFREIFENIAAPVAVIDAQLRLHERNSAFVRLFDGRRGDLLTDCFEPGQDAHLAELRSQLAAGGRWRGMLRLRRRGEVRETEWRVTFYRPPDVGILFVQDITEQRQRERSQLQQLESATSQLAHEVEERSRAEAQLLQAQKMDSLGKLTGGIAHDFNNLLTGIITGVELIGQRVEDGQPEDVPRFAGMVLNAARRAGELTHRMLAFARQQPLNARAVDVNQHIRSLGDLLHRSIDERVVLKLELAGDPVVARVDAGQLENAVLNLVINARDALPCGGEIHVCTAPFASRSQEGLVDGDYIAVSVRDNGSGIDPAVIDKVFEPFFTTKPIGQGTGLGLSMIYGFARQSGGHVRIHSVLGEGTEVTLLLPADRLAAEPAPLAGKPPQKGGGERVLIVEDMANVRVLATEVLLSGGYECVAVDNVEAALRALGGDDRIDLLLTDVGLPGMDGRALAEEARGWRPQLPVLFMTGYTRSAVEKDKFLGPQMDLVGKPFEIGVLLGKVRELLDGR